jgi:hypothetical protein
MTGVEWAAQFEAAVRKLQVDLGLLDWAFRFETVEGDDTKAAEVNMDRDSREAVFTAYTKGEHPDTPERIAFHESLHVLVNEMQELAAERGNHDHRDVAREEHRFIERMGNFVFGRP